MAKAARRVSHEGGGRGRSRGHSMTLTVGDLVIELSPHWEELGIFLYGFDRQMMGWSALFPRAPGQIRHITNR
eukprot:scaffold3518_cov73-Skeletonema_dohrnii-CCMP3373.AAC.1